MDHKEWQEFRSAMNEAVKAAAKAHGLNAELVGGVISPGGSMLKCSVTFTTEGDSEYEVVYRNYHQLYGCQLAWLGKEVEYKGRKVLVKGMKPRSHSVVFQDLKAPGTQLFRVDPTNFAAGVKRDG